MSKIINGVASEYDMPMKYENKTMTSGLKNEEIFTRWQDPTIDNLQQENTQLKSVLKEIREYIEHNKMYVKLVGRDFLKDKNELGSLDEEQVDELLEKIDKGIGEDK